MNGVTKLKLMNFGCCLKYTYNCYVLVYLLKMIGYSKFPYDLFHFCLSGPTLLLTQASAGRWGRPFQSKQMQIDTFSKAYLKGIVFEMKVFLLKKEHHKLENQTVPMLAHRSKTVSQPYHLFALLTHVGIHEIIFVCKLYSFSIRFVYVWYT